MGKDLEEYISACFVLAFRRHGAAESFVNFVVVAAAVLWSFFGAGAWLSEHVIIRIPFALAGIFIMNMLFVSPFKLYRAHVAEIRRFREPVSLHFVNSGEYIVRNRAHYQSDRISLRMDVKRRLSDVRVWVESIHRVGDDGSLSTSMNDGSKFALGMPYGDRSFEPRNVFGTELVVVFHHRGGTLSVFTDSDVRELTPWKDDLPHGKYRINLAIDSPSLDVAISKSLLVFWDGSLDNFSIAVL